MGDGKRITVIVSKEMHLSLKLEAAKHETTVSHILRSLIKDWLDTRQEQAADKSLSS